MLVPSVIVYFGKRCKMKVHSVIEAERPVIKCPKCKMTFCVDHIDFNMDDYGKFYYYVNAYQTCNETYCFYCRHKLTKKNEVKR